VDTAEEEFGENREILCCVCRETKNKDRRQKNVEKNTEEQIATSRRRSCLCCLTVDGVACDVVDDVVSSI